MTNHIHKDSDVYRNSEKSFAFIYPWLHKISYLEIDFSLFSVRPSNCFRRAQIFKWGDLADKTQTEVFNLPNFGGTSFNEVHKVLKEMSIDWSGIDSFGESEEDILKELKNYYSQVKIRLIDQY